MTAGFRPAPGTLGYAGAIVIAQIMAQIGGFALRAAYEMLVSRRPRSDLTISTVFRIARCSPLRNRPSRGVGAGNE